MNILNLSLDDGDFGPKKLSFSEAVSLTYNSLSPTNDFMFVGKYRTSTQEFFDDDLTTLNLRYNHLSIEDLDPFWQESIKELFSDSSEGVDNVVAIGKVCFYSHHTEFGVVEHECDTFWEIISANKFIDFRSLKTWWKSWKTINKDLMTKHPDWCEEEQPMFEKEIPDIPPVLQD